MVVVLTLAPRTLQVAQALADLGGGATPGDLAHATAVPPRSVSEALARLRDAGLVDGPKTWVRLTSSGRARFAATGTPAAPKVSAGRALDEACAVWPYGHAALLRLLLSAVIARRHLGPSRPSAHLGFVLVGEGRTGKSALVEMACHLLGADPVEHTRNLALLSEGEVIGRRVPQPGGQLAFLPSATLELPLVLVDEYDKASTSMRSQAQLLFQGQYRATVEGEAHVIAPTPVLAANVPAHGGRLSQVHEVYRRRSVVLDTGPARSQLGDLGARLASYYQAHAQGSVDLEHTVPPALDLPETAQGLVAFMRDQALTELGWEQLPDERALYAAALGRAALAEVAADDAKGLNLAAYATCLDYLACTETIPGEVREGWEVDVEAVGYYAGTPGTDSFRAALDSRHQGQQLQQAAISASRVRQGQAGRQVLEDRGRLLEVLRLAHGELDGRRVPRPYKPDAAGLRAVLAQLRRDASHVERADRLADLSAAAADPLARAAALRARINHEQAAEAVQRRQVQQDLAEQKHATLEERRRTTSIRQTSERHTRAAATDQLGYVRDLAKPLERLWERTSGPAFPVLRDLRVDGEQLLAYRSATRRTGLKMLAAALQVLEAGMWVLRDERVQVAFPGTPTSCPALAVWGENTRAVLWPTLAALHAHEDLLLSQHGHLRQRRRPQLHVPQQRALTAAR